MNDIEQPIHTLTEMASLANDTAAQCESCLKVIDEWEEARQKRYERIDTALVAALEALDAIKSGDNGKGYNVQRDEFTA